MSNLAEEIFDEEKQAAMKHSVGDLDGHTDPFALREGKTLIWKNVNMTLVRLQFMRVMLLHHNIEYPHKNCAILLIY